MPPTQYRPEIDGLRALAVLSVILFRAGFPVFRGGFVGVDVFFVISGYLITTLIVAEKDSGAFSLRHFYERRARRILPALFLVAIVCMPFAWMWLLPGELKDFAISLVAASSFSSNVLFWRESGYFETAAALKPLHHTWSLAIEEQYYLLFPPVIIATWRLGRKWVVTTLAAGALISLVAASWGTVHKPAATFFLLPTRSWELLLGSLASFYQAAKGSRNHDRVISEAAGFAGVAMLIYAVLLFDDATPFPGLYALVPTVAAALLVTFATPRTIVGRMLGAQPLVNIGLISYSAYLWHQPLFAFARHRILDDPDHALRMSLLLVLLVLAYLTWYFVEQPFRNHSAVSRAAIVRLGISGSIALSALGIYGYASNGFEARFNGRKGEFARYFEDSLPEWRYRTREAIFSKYREDCNFYDIQQYRLGNVTVKPVPAISHDCFSRDRTLSKSAFIWGDSHAQALNFGLKNHLPPDWQLLQVASSSCGAVLNAPENRDNYCDYSNWFAYKAISESRPDVVIIDEDEPVKMAELATDLRRHGVNRVVFVGPAPQWKAELPKLIIYRMSQNTPRRTFFGVDRTILELDHSLKASFKQSENVRLASVVDYLCSSDGCLTYLGNDVKRGVTTFDGGHLSPIASDAFGRDVLVPLVTAVE